jgi:NarL family two-component system response regulator LiaR
MAKETNKIRVMVVDDHKVVRGGLSDFLYAYDDLELVGEASSGENAILICPEVNPDVILMDLVMDGIDGAEATRAIRASHPHIQVIVLTSFKDDELVQNAIRAGAIGYLLKNVSAAELAEAIRNAHAGRPTLSPEAAQALIDVTKSPKKIGDDLTARQNEVLQLMIEGCSNADIGERLSISPATVKHHVRAVLEKLEASNRSEAVAIAIRNDLME